MIVATASVAIALVAIERREAARSITGASSRDERLTCLRGDMVVIGLVVLVGGTGLARLLARPVARPIEGLAGIARAIAAGDLSRRVPATGTREADDVAVALRALSEQLESRRQERAAEEGLLLALTESLNEGVIAVDSRRNVVRLNETARQLLRLREAVPFPADYLPRDRALHDALDAVLSGAEAIPDELRVEDRTMSMTARPLPDGGAMLALYDLTPFRRLEAVRRDFVANVSHELRTPLTVVTGFVETLADEDLPVALRRQFLGMVAGNVQRMQRIVDDLLDLSRIESGGWLPNPVKLDVEALAEEIVQPLQAAAGVKGVVLRVEVAANASTIFADSTATRQIFSNLAENALRHTTCGEIVLFSESDHGGHWIGVRDTGIGIGADQLPRIFERFYRADPARAREAGGTGLGLAIVRHLAEAHGGRVRAESIPGQGTSIATYFPGDDTS